MFLVRNQQPFSFFNSLNPFEFEREDSFESPFFSDFFENSFLTTTPKSDAQLRKTKLKKRISKLKNQGQSLLNHIKRYEASVDEMKKSFEEIEKQSTELQQEFDAISTEESVVTEKTAAINCSDEKNNKNKKAIEKRVFKKTYYKTPEIEIEEQYDSTDPKKCFKIIRKEGEVPQILNTHQQEAIENSSSQQAACCEHSATPSK